MQYLGAEHIFSPCPPCSSDIVHAWHLSIRLPILLGTLFAKQTGHHALLDGIYSGSASNADLIRGLWLEKEPVITHSLTQSSLVAWLLKKTTRYEHAASFTRCMHGL